MGYPPPGARAGQGRDLRAGPQKGARGGGGTLVTQGACGWAQNASLSLCNAACDRSSAEVGACRCLRAATTAATANTTATMPNFAGTWKMRSSENFDELLKALGKLVRRGCRVY